MSSELAQGLAHTRRSRRRSLRPRPRRPPRRPSTTTRPPPAWIGKIINDAFSPLGQAAVTWALRVAWWRVALPPELGQLRQRRVGSVPVHAGHLVRHTVGESNRHSTPSPTPTPRPGYTATTAPAGGLVSRGSNSHTAATRRSSRGAGSTFFLPAIRWGPARRRRGSGRSAGWGDPSLVFRLYGDLQLIDRLLGASSP